MRCDSCGRVAVVTVLNSNVVFGKRYTWRNCVPCELKERAS